MINILNKMKIKPLLLVLIIAATALPPSVNANGADSLKQLYNNSSGKNRIEIALKIISAIQRTNPNEAVSYGNEAIKLIEKFPDKNLEIEVGSILKTRKENKQKSYDFQRSRINKIGIENIRISKLKKLEKDHQQWLKEFNAGHRTLPHLKNLLSLRINV